MADGVSASRDAMAGQVQGKAEQVQQRATGKSSSETEGEAAQKKAGSASSDKDQGLTAGLMGKLDSVVDRIDTAMKEWADIRVSVDKQEAW